MSLTLDVDKLTVERGAKRVLNEISIRLAQGRTTAILGPNGAGKSSLVQAIAGILPASSGKISLGERKLNGLPPEAIRALGIATVLEGHRVLTALSVDDNLKTAGCLLGRAALSTSLERAYAIFPELLEHQTQPAGSLSGGQQQMLALAQALMARPAFVLADEMSLGLAPVVVKRLMQVLRSLAGEGCGILLIEQFTHVALRLADHVYVLNRGRVQFHGTPADVARQPSILHDAYFAGASIGRTQALPANQGANPP